MRSSTQRFKLSARELAIFATLGAMMFVSRAAMSQIPNIHPLALFIGASTVVYRSKALFAVYVFVFLDLLYQGVSPFWVPKLYLYLPLWGMFMLVSKINMSPEVKVPVYAVVAGLNGLMFGALWTPWQAVMFGLNFDGMVTWWLAGVRFDIVHAVGNFAAGLLIVPFAATLQRLNCVANIKK